MSEYHYDFKMWTHNGVIKVVSSDYETFPALRFTGRLIGVQVECEGGVFVTYDQLTAGMHAPNCAWIESVEERRTLMGMKVIKMGLHPVTMAQIYENMPVFENLIKEP